MCETISVQVLQNILQTVASEAARAVVLRNCQQGTHRQFPC